MSTAPEGASGGLLYCSTVALSVIQNLAMQSSAVQKPRPRWVRSCKRTPMLLWWSTEFRLEGRTVYPVPKLGLILKRVVIELELVGL
jgi:hypothetical protein